MVQLDAHSIQTHSHLNSHSTETADRTLPDTAGCMLITSSVCLSQASGSRVNDLVLVCRQPVPGALPNDAVQTGHVYDGGNI